MIDEAKYEAKISFLRDKWRMSVFTTDNWVFQEFLVLVGKMVHGDLVRRMEYLKVENQILRSKLGRRIVPSIMGYISALNICTGRIITTIH